MKQKRETLLDRNGISLIPKSKIKHGWSPPWLVASLFTLTLLLWYALENHEHDNLRNKGAIAVGGRVGESWYEGA